MQSLIDTLYHMLLVPHNRYGDSISQLRARVTLVFSLLLMMSSALGLIGLAVQPGQGVFSNTVFLGATIALLMQFAVLALVHAGALQSAMLLFFVSAIASAAGVSLSNATSAFLLVYAFPVLYASLVWFWRGTLLATSLEIGLVIITGVLQTRGMITPLGGGTAEQVSLQTLLTLIGVVGIGAASGAISYELQRAIRHVNQLLIRLRATAELATQSTSTITTLNDLLKQTVNYLRDRFAFYHVHLFLVDNDRRFANLVASTSDVGDILMQRGYRLGIGSPSTIGQAMVSGEPVFAGLEERASLIQPFNELSHDVRSELALPLAVSDQIIGVLSIQSARPNAFSQEDIDSLRIMATHISIAIHNGQIFEEQRTALNENRRLFLEAELNLREIQRLNQRLTGEAWDDYLKSHHTDTVGYTLINNQLRADSTWTPLLEQAASKRRAAIQKEGDLQSVAVPVELRGRTIGAIEVEMNSSVRQSDALDMLQALAQRLALSIDNARLFEQAQELAQQELQVNAISTKMQSVTQMDEIMITTLAELGKALGAETASVRLAVTGRQSVAESLPRAAKNNGNSSAGGNNGSKGTAR